MVHMQAFFTFCLQNIYKPPLSGRKAGNSSKKSRMVHKRVSRRRGRCCAGCGIGVDPYSFWSGLIDDVRIYDRSVKP